MADQDEQSPRWRFFERLEERIRRFGVEIVSRIDDANTPAPRSRRVAEELSRPAGIIDGDFAFDAAGLGIEAPLDREKVGMATRSNPMEDGGSSRNLKRRRARTSVRIRELEQEPPQAIGQRRL